MNVRSAILVGVVGFSLLAAVRNGLASAESSFQDGVEDCRAGRFTQATRAFHDSLKEQPAAGTFLNLGIAEWRRGQVGKAMLAWEQALWIDPFNHEAHNNLEFARQVADLESPDLTWYEIASTWLPANAWAWLAGGSLWLAVAMVTLPGILRLRKAGWHQALAALGLGAFLLSIPAYIGVVTRTHVGFVLEKDVPLRLTPTHEAESTTSLRAGEPARKVRTHGDYYFIRTQQSSGWVERKQFGLLCEKSE